MNEWNKPNGIDLFPNPAKDLINIHWGATQNADVLVVQNALGAVIWTESVSSINQMQLDLSKWNNGVYFIRLGNETKKFIIAR
jgi:hypothetical protein